MRRYVPDNEAGPCCRVLAVNWAGCSSFLFLGGSAEQARERRERALHVAQVLQEVRLCENQQEEELHPVWEGGPVPEDQEYPDYCHAEHYGDAEKGGFYDTDNFLDSDTEYNIYFEGNCCWKGGVIIGYSSDGDFS